MIKSDKIRYFRLNLRSGKPAVIDAIIKNASGDIIVINDADWIFKVDNPASFNRLFSVFDREDIGGIAESFPVEWDEYNMKNSNFGYKMVAHSTFLWLEYQKEKMTYKKEDLVYLSTPTMFLTNIFRKSLYKKNISLGDDFERTKNIMDAGYKVIIFDEPSVPRMIATYDTIKIKDLIKQKIRTAIARRQLNRMDIANITVFGYYLPATWFILKRGWKNGPYIWSAVTLWVIITSLGELVSKFKKSDTLGGWALRAER